MNTVDCDPLAVTGVATNLGILLIIAIVCVLAGTTAILLARKRGSRGAGLTAAVLLAFVVVGATIAVAPVTPAEAGTVDCLTITQTSRMEGLAPGVPPSAIAGLVENHDTVSAYVTEVKVEIASVTRSAEAPMGDCTASDYRILDSLMPVGRTLAPGESTSFTGAYIGFANNSTNQDACKHAVVHLLYTANPQ